MPQGGRDQVLLEITTTHTPATDLGYLLHKHPERVQSFEVSSGTAHVFYPEVGVERCTAALLLEVDPVGLVRRQRGGAGHPFALRQYVNDRPYVASSLVAVTLNQVFGTAMAGRCRERPELPDTAIPLRLRLPTLPCRGGAELATRIFQPLGWSVAATPIPLDPRFPEWGDSRYLDLTLTGVLRLADALQHLYVALPVLDDAKHYWVTSDEIDKLIRAGGGWLATHPERTLITTRYLAHRRELVQTATARLSEVDDAVVEPAESTVHVATAGEAADDVPGQDEPGEDEQAPVPLARQRRGAVLAALRSAGARRVADLGCGEGALLRELLADPTFEEIIGVDVSPQALLYARRRLRLDRMSERLQRRLRLFQSSLTYRDPRLAGLDAAVLMEVVEHVDPPRLPTLERAVFGAAAPRTVVVTTPNVEYNVRFPTLPAGRLRHGDHRFEWSRGEFGEWAESVATRYGYTVRYLPVGAVDEQVGPPTQMAIFTRRQGGDGPREQGGDGPREGER